MGIERLREWERLHPRKPRGYIPPELTREGYPCSSIDVGPSIDLASLTDGPPPKSTIKRKPRIAKGWQRELERDMSYALEHMDHGELPDPRVFSIDNRQNLHYYEIPEGYQEVVAEKEELPIEVWLKPEEEE